MRPLIQRCFLVAVLAVSVLPPATAQTAMTADQAEPIARATAEAAVPNPADMALSAASAGRCQFSFCLEDPFDPLTGTSRAWKFLYFTKPPEGGRRPEIHVFVQDGIGEVVGTSNYENHSVEIADGWFDSDDAVLFALSTPHPYDERWTGQAFLDGYPEAEVHVRLWGETPTLTTPQAHWYVAFLNRTDSCYLEMGYRLNAYSGALRGWSWGVSHDGPPGSCPPPVSTETGPPSAFALGAPYPNPAGPRVAIPFELGLPGRVRLEVFDVMGRLVATLVDGVYNAGAHSELWITERLAPGTYMVRLRSAEVAQTVLVAVP